ncbi:hypothetical protein CDAR_398541 [Caerostris darwini]|uniref:Uncharacterized protein n=1 Tax=Caerostris darwini TaxID=1538125 RepID=A0AAV4VDX9_9ARAC|nr:hypothetical protein CDAR_398541 [Caerostris darwini]
MSRRKQAKPRSLKREEMENIPDESAEEIELSSITDVSKECSLPGLIGQDNSSMLDATLYDNSLETITSNQGTMDIDISSESNIQCRLRLFYNADNEIRL